MQKIYHNERLIGILVKNWAKGSVPQTDVKNPLQILTWNHKKGYHCGAHYHAPLMRTTEELNECFVVQKGKVKFKLFGLNKTPFKTMTLKAGDIYLHIFGAHEVEVTEDCMMFEVKNGPFREDKVFI
jgi:hypothetical protein